MVRNFQQNEQRLQQTTYRGEGRSEQVALLKLLKRICKAFKNNEGVLQVPNSSTRWWTRKA
jgi:hypothetical protein